MIGVLPAVLHNPNPGWDEHSRLFALAEIEGACITAGPIGYDREAPVEVNLIRVSFTTSVDP